MRHETFAEQVVYGEVSEEKIKKDLGILLEKMYADEKWREYHIGAFLTKLSREDYIFFHAYSVFMASGGLHKKMMELEKQNAQV